MMNAQQRILGFKDPAYAFLSNMALVQVYYDERRYNSVEHAYQAAKTLEDGTRKLIQACATPYLAKRMGKSLVLRQDWHQIKLTTMENLLRQKFSQQPFKYKLQSTGEAYLEETNWWNDTYWGVCKGVGDNHLGKLLMKIREELL